MFELQVALRYLIPKKRALSTALISLISLFVISLVVWLVIVFLSVTNGIEKRWLDKLTSIHAPIRITPTQEYFDSYYYKIDSISQSSNFSLKNLDEKLTAVKTDPYLSNIDQEIPLHWPQAIKNHDGTTKDFAKDLDAVLRESSISRYQDYEMAGALLRLNLVRDFGGSSQISQMSYVLSFPDLNPHLSKILEPVSLIELQNMLDYDPNTDAILENIEIQKIATKEGYKLSTHALDTQKVYQVHYQNGDVYLLQKAQKTNAVLRFEQGWKCFYQNNTYPLNEVHLFHPFTLSVLHQNARYCVVKVSIQNAVHQFSFPIEQGVLLEARAKTHFKTKPSIAPPWAHYVESENRFFCDGIVVPKSFRKNGVQITDAGYFSFISPSAGSMIEQQLPIKIAGFYDPGILPIGNKCVFASKEYTKILNDSSALVTPDGTPTNGIFVWIDDPANAKQVQKKLWTRLDQKQIRPYFEITTFHDFEFAKNLLQQFQSDRILFSMIAGIILLVACSNIISMLILLVNDKKKEIAMLYAMGASRKNILSIFVLCGLIIGLSSCILGFLLAVLTLHNLDAILHFLGYLQGHDLFQASFFGDTLPNQMSMQAIFFVILLTPILSILAGLIPAWKACNIRASNILRS